MIREFHKLTVVSVRPEINGGATSLRFDIPPALQEVFEWQAGQHITVRFAINGKEERRSYTISNPPGSPLQITVKRVKGGKVSNHIGDTLSPGDQVEIMPPFGGFALSPGITARRTHYFFGAGSGITPLIAMIHEVLAKEPHSVAHLVYGNATQNSILFGDELDALSKAHPTRFTLRHVLSAPSMWSWFSPWRSGRVDAGAIGAAMAETPPIAQDVHYWICGPGQMNGDVKSALIAMDVPMDRIHMESFGAAQTAVPEGIGIAATAEITLGGAVHVVPVEQGQTLLSASLKAGVAVPYSCQSGVCGACKARLVDGKVHMANHMALDDLEKAKGAILTCQSLAESSALKLRFDS